MQNWWDEIIPTRFSMDCGILNSFENLVFKKSCNKKEPIYRYNLDGYCSNFEKLIGLLDKTDGHQILICNFACKENRF